MSSIIVIPARYGSTRLPGKPLIKIAGKTLLQHVCEAAMHAAKQMSDVSVLVATDDQKIMQHAQDLKVDAVMTPTECASGSDRIIAAIQQLKKTPKYIINLQGDAPLTPPRMIVDLLNAIKLHDVVTPVKQLTWQDLDNLRSAKEQAPFSGTCAIVNTNNDILWFSKQIIPALRNEKNLRASSNTSPIFQHLGIYGYTLSALEAFAKWPQSFYEQLEGLEQLRFLENGYKIKAVPIATENLNAWRGVDTLEDARYVEQLLLKGLTKV